ncbi:triose-phosphate transporter family-domain-containing protein [Schizophyllum commune]
MASQSWNPHQQPQPEEYPLTEKNGHESSSSSSPRARPTDLPPSTDPTPQSSWGVSLTSVNAVQIFWLSLYFVFNLALTLYNKQVLNRFPFPYALTALHCLFGMLGTFACVLLKMFKPPRLNSAEKTAVLLFSMLYSINIVVSNASLGLVTVPVHQVIRAATPIFTMLFSSLLLSRHPSRGKVLSLIPVMAGVGIATYGDYYFTAYGFFLTTLGTVLAALKTVFTNVLQSPPRQVGPQYARLPQREGDEDANKDLPSPNTAANGGPAQQLPRITIPLTSKHSISFPTPTLSLNPMALLYALSPLALVQCLFLSWATGEWSQVVATMGAKYGFREATTPNASEVTGLGGLALNGTIAFLLNVVSFNTNKRVGAVGMSVAANVKQALTIVLSVVIFHLVITPINGFGIMLTVAGGAIYAWVELEEKKKKRLAAAAATAAPA